MKQSLPVCALVFLCLIAPPEGAAQSVVTFDFDAGSPALNPGQTTPFSQTSGGIKADFNSPGAAAFAIQTDGRTGWKMPAFSGNYLADSDLNRSTLSIKFSAPLSAISVGIATGDNQIEVPTNVQLTAYQGSNTTPAVGSVSGHGAYSPSSTWPAGTLTFTTPGQAFDLVELTIPFQVGGATVFFIDNVKVTPASAITSVSAASYTVGPLAPSMIASGFGQNLAPGVGTASTVPLPNILGSTTVSVKDSAGVARLAPLFYVSPTQINFTIPDQTASGAATITVGDGPQAVATGFVTIDPVAPGIFTANNNGLGAPAATAVNSAQVSQNAFQCGAAAGSCVTKAIDLGAAGTQVVLVLYGTGIRGRSALSAVSATIGGAAATVLYAGAQSQYAGLDQVNLEIPRSLAGRGEVDLILVVDGKVSNTVRVNIK